MNLYELSHELQKIEHQLAELDAQDLSEDERAAEFKRQLGELQEGFDARVLSLLKWRANLEADVLGLKAEEERLAKLRKSNERKVEWLARYIREGMESAGQPKLDLGIFKLSLTKPRERVEFAEDIEELAPSWPANVYDAVCTSSIKIDKAELKRQFEAAVRAGRIPGVSIVLGPQGLSIR